MKSILNTLTKMNNAIGLATLCGAIATTAVLAGSASASPFKGMDQDYVCVGSSRSVITKIDPRLTDELLVQVKGPDSNVRMIAARALGRIGESYPGVIDELLVLAKGPDSNVRMIVVQALGCIGQRYPMVIDELVLLLKDPDSDIRVVVTQSLGRIGQRYPMVIDELVLLLKDPDSDVRRTAAQSLSDISIRERGYRGEKFPVNSRKKNDRRGQNDFYRTHEQSGQCLWYRCR
jgi:HEAT repeat protein